MEYIEGSSCAEILRDDGWVEVDEALRIIEQACEGLHYAHRHGVVHRDVKPGNLLRAREGGVKLADFGIAKATEQSSITQVGSVLGTAAYLAPEQARGEEAGPSADLYALGVVTYQLISGRLPYEATSLTELALKQQQEEPPTLDTLVAAVSPELADAVAIALALDPRERYATARDMRRGLSEGARGIPPSEPRSAPSRTAPATSATTVLEPERRPAGPGKQASSVTPRRPRQAPAKAPAAPPAARPRRPAPARRSSRPLLLLLGLLAVVLAVIAAVLISAPSSTKVVAAQRGLHGRAAGILGTPAARLRKHQVAAGGGARGSGGTAPATATSLGAHEHPRGSDQRRAPRRSLRLPPAVPARDGRVERAADPGETGLIAAGVLASSGKLEIGLVIAIAAAAAIVGDNIGYLIGRKGGRWLLERPGRFYTQRRRS